MVINLIRFVLKKLNRLTDMKKIKKIKYSFQYDKTGPKDIDGNYPFVFVGPIGFKYSTEVLDKINEIITVLNKKKNEENKIPRLKI